MLEINFNCKSCGNEIEREIQGDITPTKHKCEECGAWLTYWNSSRGYVMTTDTVRLIPNTAGR